MKNIKPFKIKEGITLTGIISGVIPIFYQGLWIFFRGLNDDQMKAAASFKKFLPPFLKEPYAALKFFLELCILSIILNTINLVGLNKYYKNVSLVTLISSCLLIFILLFQMM